MEKRSTCITSVESVFPFQHMLTIDILCVVHLFCLHF